MREYFEFGSVVLEMMMLQGFFPFLALVAILFNRAELFELLW